MVTAEQFIEKARIPLDEKWGYIYGTWGTTWTKEKQAASTREMTVRYGSKWIGCKVTDCSGLIRRALYWLGETIAHHATYQYTDYCARKGLLKNGLREDGTPPLPGSAMFLKGKETRIHHVGVYIGGDVVIEAKGTVYGVVTSHLNHWDHWGELDMVDYSEAAQLEREDLFPQQDSDDDAQAGTIFRAVVTNPNRFLNVRMAGSGGASIEFQVEKGDVVEVLDAGEPDWWQIRYGGRTGWASAKFLTPVNQDSEESESSQERTEDSQPRTDDSQERTEDSQTRTEDSQDSDQAAPAVRIEQIERLLQAADSIADLAKELQEILASLKEGARP